MCVPHHLPYSKMYFQLLSANHMEAYVFKLGDYITIATVYGLERGRQIIFLCVFFVTQWATTIVYVWQCNCISKNKLRLDWKWQKRGKNKFFAVGYTLYIHTVVYGNAVGLPVALAGMMMMRCKSKSHYTSLWVLLSPLTDNCIGLWCYENDSLVLVPFFMVRPDMIFERTGANTLDFLWCPFVSHGARRSWDCEIGIGRKERIS